MIARGIVTEGEPYELLDGKLVHKNRNSRGGDPMTVGREHAWVVTALAELSTKLKRSGCHMRVQQPLTLPPADEPEPDGVIAKGSKNDYRERHPGADDAVCVIEVADASLRFDRTAKLALYAKFGIPCYVIINLMDRCIELHQESRKGKKAYGNVTTLSLRQSVAFPIGGEKQLVVPVKKLLP